MKIWGRDNSTNVRKVLWCAEELGLQYEHIPAGGNFGVVASQESHHGTSMSNSAASSS